MTWIATARGHKFDFHHLDPDSIDIEDIALALSRQPRFAGHTNKLYTVAQHSVLVALQCPWDLRLEGLLHDASEAYLCDMPLPAKLLIPEYRDLEHRVMLAIAQKFRFVWPSPPEVKQADLVLLETEHRDLMPHSPPWDVRHAEPLEGMRIEPWEPWKAERMFLDCFAMWRRKESRQCTQSTRS